MSVIDLDESTFDEMVKGSDKLVAVEFYLMTCPVCAQVESIYNLLSEELKEDATFARVDAEANMMLSSRFGVIGTPTFKFFCEDEMIGEIIGGISETGLRNTIKDMLRHKMACASQAKEPSYDIDGYG